MSEGRSRTFLVTGSSGFIGRRVCAALEASGWTWRGLARHPVRPSDIAGDLSLAGPWADLVRAFDPSDVIHLAGLPRAGSDTELQRHHVAATRRLMEGLGPSCRWILLSSSGAVYGDAMRGTRPIGEDCPAAPLDGYGRSKLAQENAFRECAEASGMTWCVARIANPIGAGQSEEYFLGRLLRELRRPGPEPAMMGDLSATRDFVDLRDLADGLVALAERRCSGVFNVGSGRETALAEVVEKARAACATSRPVASRGDAGPSRITRQALSVDRIREATGWQPRHDLCATLEWMIAAGADAA